jgi:hypothetical protein
MIGDVDVGNDSAGAADGGAEGGPEVRWSSVRGWCSEPVQVGVGGEEMALGAGAGAEWSGVLTGCIVGNCRGSARKSDSSAIGDVVGIGLSSGGERARGGVRRGGGT